MVYATLRMFPRGEEDACVLARLCFYIWIVSEALLMEMFWTVVACLHLSATVGQWVQKMRNLSGHFMRSFTASQFVVLLSWTHSAQFAAFISVQDAKYAAVFLLILNFKSAVVDVVSSLVVDASVQHGLSSS